MGETKEKKEKKDNKIGSIQAQEKRVEEELWKDCWIYWSCLLENLGSLFGYSYRFKEISFLGSLGHTINFIVSRL